MIRTAFFAIGCVVFLSCRLLAAEATVTAVLSNSETAVGQPVQLQIKVNGSSSATPPSDIAVDGLDIRYTGQSQLLEGHNFQFTYSYIYNFTVMPLKAGQFRIPPQTLRAGTSSIRTPELVLNVVDSPGGSSARSNGAAETIDPNKVAFVELILTKSTAYVGEMIPAEVRLGFNVRTPVESLGNGIEITGQGFTTQKMKEPRQTVETIRGRTYQTFTFKTAIAPARSGKIEIGPVEVNPVIRMPRPARSLGIPRDPFNMNDPFLNDFFNDPAFAPSTPREIKLKSEPSILEVKALPPNAPPTFAGAVGIFTMSSEAKPKSVQVGDPFTVTARISGRGNFDRVTAPALEDERGWHKYPPSSNFKQDDDVGISGAKTFETVLSPNERKENIPAQLFSYFDPLKEEYVTLRSERIPVRVEGGPAPTAPLPTTAPAISSAPPAPAPRATASAKQQDILHQLTELPASSASFTPYFVRRSFWLAQLIPFVALLGFIGWKIRRASLDNREAQRRHNLQQEAAELQRNLRRSDVSPREYLSYASRAVQVKAALAKNINPNAVDAEIAASAFRADEQTRLRLRQLFAQSDEARYSGENGAALIAPETRAEVLELIEKLRI